jgi:hypothetical protein
MIMPRVVLAGTNPPTTTNQCSHWKQTKGAIMKKTIISAVVLAGLCGGTALADETSLVNTNAPASAPAGENYNYDHKLGVGVILGEPTGGSVKYWLSDTLAVDGAAGWSSHHNTDLYVHGDVLWHNFELIPVSQGRLPVYVGVGGLVRFRDNGDDNQAGVRVPVGLSYMFDHAPVDIFAEIAPAVIVTPNLRGDLTGGIGVRLWF